MPIRPEVAAHHPAEVLFGRTVRWSIVVGQVKVCDALVERVPQHLALDVEGAVVAEVVPEPERDGGQDQTRVADSAVHHGVVAIPRCAPRIQGVRHAFIVEIDAHASHPSCAPSGSAPVRRPAEGCGGLPQSAVASGATVDLPRRRSTCVRTSPVFTPQPGQVRRRHVINVPVRQPGTARRRGAPRATPGSAARVPATRRSPRCRGSGPTGRGRRLHSGSARRRRPCRAGPCGSPA